MYLNVPDDSQPFTKTQMDVRAKGTRTIVEITSELCSVYWVENSCENTLTKQLLGWKLSHQINQSNIEKAKASTQ